MIPLMTAPIVLALYATHIRGQVRLDPIPLFVIQSQQGN